MKYVTPLMLSKEESCLGRWRRRLKQPNHCGQRRHLPHTLQPGIQGGRCLWKRPTLVDEALMCKREVDCWSQEVGSFNKESLKQHHLLLIDTIVY